MIARLALKALRQDALRTALTMRSIVIGVGAVIWVVAIGEGAQASVERAAPAPAQPRAVTRTLYTRNTELFAESRPLVAGRPTRLSAHLTRLGDGLRPYAEAKVSLILTVAGTTATAAADAPERAGVFRLNVTPALAGAARLVIDVAAATGSERFVIDDVPVYADVAAALAKDTPEEAGLISYSKERSWEEDFATAPVTVHFPGAGNVITVPATAILREGETTRVYVQRTPERFELRDVKTRRTIGDAVEIVSGLHAGERVVVRGADKMPRQ